MKIFDVMEQCGHEQVVFCRDKASGLRAVIAIHSTALGPALGGARMHKYESEEEVLVDALRLSRGMTYKASAMGLRFGGGKAVIWADPDTEKTPELLKSFGRFVERLGGAYVTAEDVGTTVDDMSAIASETSNVAGRDGISGDPSPATAYGVYLGMKAAAQSVWGSDTLKDKVIAVQGLGKVGYALCELLFQEGAVLRVADVRPQIVKRAVREFNAAPVTADEICGVSCDVFSPCALGGVVNDATVPLFKCKIIAGSANNQLQEARHAKMLQDRGILYCPDYLVNGGGLINVAEEYASRGYNESEVQKKIATIPEKLRTVFRVADAQGITTAEASDLLVEQRMSPAATSVETT